MGLTSAQLRTAWKAYEGARDKLVDAQLGNSTIPVAPESSEAFEALAAVLNAYGYSVRTPDTATYSNRNIANSNKKSLHAYGIALDLNWNTNPIKYNPQSPVRFSQKSTQDARAKDVVDGKADTDMQKTMVDDILAIRTNDGKRIFEWGGNWRTKIDTMHFEMDVVPTDLKVGVNWATVRGFSEEPFVNVDANGTDTHEESGAVWSTIFEQAHQHVEKWEGGFVNHPQDPGGATNFGITRRTLARWRDHPVTVNDVRTMTIQEARRIFYTKYWMPMQVEEIPFPLALMAYNCGVNSGISRGQKFLQRTLNMQGTSLVVDGVVGSKTIAAANSADTKRGVQDFSNLYENFYRGLSTWSTFGKGWMNRLNDISAIADGDSGPEILAFGTYTNRNGGTHTDGNISKPEAQDGPNDRSNKIKPTRTSAGSQLTTIDFALGGQGMVGKKTLVAGISFIALMLLGYGTDGQVDENGNKINALMNEGTFNLLLSVIATYGGLGALSKFERSKKVDVDVDRSGTDNDQSLSA